MNFNVLKIDQIVCQCTTIIVTISFLRFFIFHCENNIFLYKKIIGVDVSTMVLYASHYIVHI